MNPLVRPLHAALRLNTRLFHNCLEGVSDEAARRRPDGRANSVAFIALHLVDSRHFWAKLVGAEAENPFAALLEPARGIDDLAELPPLAEVRPAWDHVSAALDARLPALTDAELAAEPAQRFYPDDPSLLGALAFLVQHDAYHVGQMALLRKQLGLPAMRWS